MKILIVDDEPDIRTFLSAIFEEHGHETVTARDGHEALAKAFSEKPDLITLDILMPDQSGIKAYRELRKSVELQATPVIIITGVAAVAPAFKSFERFIKTRKIAAPEGYLEKPIQPAAVMEVVDRVIGQLQVV